MSMVLANWWAWGLGIAGGLGVVGLIALAIFAPPMALAVWQVVAKFFKDVFATRLGFGIIVGVAVFFGTSFYQAGVDQKRFDQKTAEFRAAQKARDAEIAKDTETFVRKQIAEEKIAEQESQHELDDFKQALPPSNVFRVGDDADSLRALFWGPASGHHQGVRRTPQPHVPAGNHAGQ